MLDYDGSVDLLNRPWFALVVFAALVVITRYPDRPGQLFAFDDVNLAYAAGHFDVRLSQPQPPGYPLFVLEMRVLRWLQFKRAESILLFLALAGSTLALVVVSEFGKRLFGGLAGFFAACLLLLHPVFWHAGITSALRIQLALLSPVVAWSCWRVWNGEKPWGVRSAVILGLAAGVRPELSLLLLPLWAVCALRAKMSWREWGRALAAMTLAGLAWLIPTMFASGGPVTYIRACTEYIRDQASLGSGLFGAGPSNWQTTFWRLIAWTCCGLLSWTLPAVLAWKSKEGWDIGREKFVFFFVWLAPAFVFGLLVHMADPGHSLAIAPPIALAGGYLFNRALTHWTTQVSRWQTVILVIASLVILWTIEFRDTTTVVVRVPIIACVAGLLLKYDPVPNKGYMPRVAAAAFLLAPLVIVHLGLFKNPGWYYQGKSTAGLSAFAEQALSDLNSGLALSSRSHVQNTLGVDDRSLRAAIGLAQERPGKTTVIWEHGLVAWRKACYYLREVPVVVLDHERIRPGSPPIVMIWKGSALCESRRGQTPLSVALPAGGRIIWLINPRSEFYSLLQANFPPASAGAVYYTDLPDASGSKILGDYKLEW